MNSKHRDKVWKMISKIKFGMLSYNNGTGFKSKPMTLVQDTLQDKLAPLLDQAEGGDMAMDDQPEMDEEPPMGEEPPMSPMDDEEDEDEDNIEEELMEIDLALTEEEEKEKVEEIVNEVARRVAKRIVEAKRAHKKMNEALGRKK